MGSVIVIDQNGAWLGLIVPYETNRLETARLSSLNTRLLFTARTDDEFITDVQSRSGILDPIQYHCIFGKLPSF